MLTHSSYPPSTPHFIGKTCNHSPDRDFTVFTINWYGQAKLEPGATYSNRGFYFQSKLRDVQTTAQDLRGKTDAEKINLEEWSPRNVDMFQSGTSLAVVAAATAEGNSATCGSLNAVCSGHSTPPTNHVPFFYITCGTNTYFGSGESLHCPYNLPTLLQQGHLIVSAKPSHRVLGVMPRLSCFALSMQFYNSILTYCNPFYPISLVQIRTTLLNMLIRSLHTGLAVQLFEAMSAMLMVRIWICLLDQRGN